ncbi:MAG: transporter suffix domain-containing protein [Deltaproteobacteria bacterium]|nr:transporter suffix domain-containing protein [Deltaproteobacteria bacterium]
MSTHSRQFKLGIILIVLSSLLYASLIVIPFLSIPVSTKLGVTPVIVIVGEIIFWIGGLLVGKEILVKYKQYFNPINWGKKKKSAAEDVNRNDNKPA